MSRKRSRRRVIDRSVTTDIVTQLECALRRPQATLIGALIGGIVPWFAHTLVHEELPAALSTGRNMLAMLLIAVVIGCAVFSAITVHKFALATFGDARKALGFVLAIEGVMLVSQGATSAVALAALIAINALGNGSSIALACDQTCRRREADVRRAATRARGRAKLSTRPVVEAEVPALRPPLVETPRWTPSASEDLVDRLAA